MGNKIRIGIVGFGNIGRGVFQAVPKNIDMALAGILSRNPGRVADELRGVTASLPSIFSMSQGGLDEFAGGIDVALLCGGSKADLPVQGPYFARLVNTVDSFDTHKHIGSYLDDKTGSMAAGYLSDVDVSARATNHTSAVAIGWDPGIFSAERVLATTFLPGAKAYAFYGLTPKGGLSMGHSDAIRQIIGVRDARQYTHAIPEAIKRIREGESPSLADGEMHWREAYVVLENDIPEERERVEKEIREMPDYFKPFRTEVHFVDLDTLKLEHSAMAHDGLVICTGETSPGNKALIEYKCQWASNPEATANIMLAHARAVHRFNEEDRYGAFRSIDFPPAYLSSRSYDELTKLV